MKQMAKLVWGVTVLSVLGTSAWAAQKTPMEKAVDARKGAMQVRAFNIGVLAAMAKGEREYDAEAAMVAATNLKLVSMMNNRAMWPKGSGNDNPALKTEALPAIWEAGSEVGTKAKAFKKAAEELAAVAGDGLSVMKPKFAALGKSCKGCHEDYREKKQK